MLRDESAIAQSFWSGDPFSTFLSTGVSIVAICNGCPASFQPKMPSAITLTFV